MIQENTKLVNQQPIPKIQENTNLVNQQPIPRIHEDTSIQDDQSHHKGPNDQTNINNSNFQQAPLIPLIITNMPKLESFRENNSINAQQENEKAYLSISQDVLSFEDIPEGFVTFYSSDNKPYEEGIILNGTDIGQIDNKINLQIEQEKNQSFDQKNNSSIENKCLEKEDQKFKEDIRHQILLPKITEPIEVQNLNSNPNTIVNQKIDNMSDNPLEFINKTPDLENSLQKNTHIELFNAAPSIPSKPFTEETKEESKEQIKISSKSEKLNNQLNDTDNVVISKETLRDFEKNRSPDSFMNLIKHENNPALNTNILNNSPVNPPWVDLPKQLFDFLNQKEELNPILAGYFSKTVNSLIFMERNKTIEYIRKNEIINNLFFHILNPSIFSIIENILILNNSNEASSQSSQHIGTNENSGIANIQDSSNNNPLPVSTTECEEKQQVSGKSDTSIDSEFISLVVNKLIKSSIEKDGGISRFSSRLEKLISEESLRSYFLNFENLELILKACFENHMISGLTLLNSFIKTIIESNNNPFTKKSAFLLEQTKKLLLQIKDILQAFIHKSKEVNNILSPNSNPLDKNVYSSPIKYENTMQNIHNKSNPVSSLKPSEVLLYLNFIKKVIVILQKINPKFDEHSVEILINLSYPSILLNLLIYFENNTIIGLRLSEILAEILNHCQPNNLKRFVQTSKFLELLMKILENSKILLNSKKDRFRYKSNTIFAIGLSVLLIKTGDKSKGLKDYLQKNKTWAPVYMNFHENYIQKLMRNLAGEITTKVNPNNQAQVYLDMFQLNSKKLEVNPFEQGKILDINAFLNFFDPSSTFSEKKNNSNSLNSGNKTEPSMKEIVKYTNMEVKETAKLITKQTLFTNNLPDKSIINEKPKVSSPNVSKEIMKIN